jgi:hypothetical protein
MTRAIAGRCAKRGSAGEPCGSGQQFAASHWVITFPLMLRANIRPVPVGGVVFRPGGVSLGFLAARGSKPERPGRDSKRVGEPAQHRYVGQ